MKYFLLILNDDMKYDKREYITNKNHTIKFIWCKTQFSNNLF